MQKFLIVYLVLISLCLLSSCHQQETDIVTSVQGHNTSYDSILDYFKTRHHKKLEPSVRRIFVLTENGCLTCNKKFLSLLKHNLSDTSAIFIVGVSANYFDISGLDSSKQVVIDQSLLETEYPMLHQSKVIYLRNKQVDTIITIDVTQIDQQFEAINKRR